MPDIIPDALHLADDGTFPNNQLPVLLWRQAILGVPDIATAIEERFSANGWSGMWRNGIFAWHHFHATAHEVLGVACGSVTVQLGGPSGEKLQLEAGDIVLLPAGTAHKNLEQSDDLLVIGAYPHEQRPDMRSGEPGERPEADRLIAQVALPQTDPVSGESGSPAPWHAGDS